MECLSLSAMVVVHHSLLLSLLQLLVVLERAAASSTAALTAVGVQLTLHSLRERTKPAIVRHTAAL